MRTNSSLFPRMITARCGLAALALAPAVLSGCAGGHGKYTRDHLNVAQERLAMLKSGTEWNMAYQQFLAGDLDKALRSVDRSIAMNATVAKSHLLRGRILMERGDLEGAETSMSKALSINPDFAEAHYFTGVLMERFNKADNAVASYSRAAEIEPSSPQFTIAAAEMMIQLGNIGDAEAYLASRAGQMEYNAGLRQTLGYCAALRGDHARAVELFNEAHVLDPDDTNITEDLIRAQVAVGSHADAEFNIATLLEEPAFDGRRDLRHLRARCLIEMGRPLEARTVLLGLTEGRSGSNDLAAWLALGRVTATLGDRARLETAAARVISISPERFEGYMLKAVSLRMRNNPAEALRQLDRAATLSGQDASPLVLRGLILHDMGRFGDAQATIAAAMQRDPSNRSLERLFEVVGQPRAFTGVDPGR